MKRLVFLLCMICSTALAHCLYYPLADSTRTISHARLLELRSAVTDTTHYYANVFTYNLDYPTWLYTAQAEWFHFYRTVNVSDYNKTLRSNLNRKAANAIYAVVGRNKYYFQNPDPGNIDVDIKKLGHFLFTDSLGVYGKYWKVDFADPTSIWGPYIYANSTEAIATDVISPRIFTIAFIVDMLWYAPPSYYTGFGFNSQEAYHTALINKLAPFVAWGIDALNSSSNQVLTPCTSPSFTKYTNPTNYPNREVYASNCNFRSNFIGALGYACLVLGDATYTDTDGNTRSYTEWLNLVVYELNNRQFNQFSADGTYTPKTGFIAALTGVEGDYVEAQAYVNDTMDLLIPFFTALKNCGAQYGLNIDYFNDPRVKGWWLKALTEIGPDYTPSPINDTYSYNCAIDSVGTSAKWPIINTHLGVLLGNTTSLTESEVAMVTSIMAKHYNDCRMILNDVNNGMQHGNSGLNSTKNIFGCPFDFYSYKAPSIGASAWDYEANASNIPQVWSNGTDSENYFTIIRKPVTNDTDLDNPWLVVNHSHQVGGHKHSSSSSFMLYYKKKPLLIDPGYNNLAGTNWGSSGYAHNTIMVNPYQDSYNAQPSGDFYGINEGTYLDYYDALRCTPGAKDGNYFEQARYYIEPYDGNFNASATAISSFTPAYKDQFSDYGSMQYLRVRTSYLHQRANYYSPALIHKKYNINRNYYAINVDSDSTYYLIYDDIDGFTDNGYDESSIATQYMNQLHFAVSSLDPYSHALQDSFTCTNGVFTYTSDENYISARNRVYLHGFMGATDNLEYKLTDTLPQGIYRISCPTDTTNSIVVPRFEHKRLSALTGNLAGDERYLMLLYPSTNSTNPVAEVAQGTGYYGCRFAASSNRTGYAAVMRNSASITFPGSGCGYDVAASFFYTELDNDLTNLRFSKLLIKGRCKLAIFDTVTPERFGYVELFNSSNTISDVTAQIENGEYNVFVQSSSNSIQPCFLIWRNGIDPKNFHCTITLPNGSTVDNPTICYNNEYFYVNYSLSSLQSMGVITIDFVVYAGDWDFSAGIPDTLTLGGNLHITGDLEIGSSQTVYVLPGATLCIDDSVGIYSYGILGAYGSETQKIAFAPQNARWKGIYALNNGAVELHYCDILGASYGLNLNSSYVDIEYCDFNQCSVGIKTVNTLWFTIVTSTIHGGHIGIFEMNPSTTSESIVGCDIYDNEYGVVIWNSDIQLLANSIYNNRLRGTWCVGGAAPSMLGNTICNTYNSASSVAGPEIYLYGSSYPVIHNYENDLNTDGNGYSLYNADTIVSSYNASYNYWMYTDKQGICDHIYPSSWNVDISNFATTSYYGFTPPRSQSMFEQALAAERDKKYTDAIRLYRTMIGTQPDSMEAAWSVSHLLMCSKSAGLNLNELRDAFDQIAADSSHVLLAKYASKAAARCERLLGHYQEAMNRYEAIMDNAVMPSDSVCAHIDMLHTYQEAAGLGTGRGRKLANLSIRHAYCAISNLADAQAQEEAIWQMLEAGDSNEANWVPAHNRPYLYANYPNPFNPSTTINFDLPNDADVNLVVYNIRGQKVATLANSRLARGPHSVIWHGRDSFGRSVSSGVYLYRLEAGGTTATKKMLLVK